MTAAYDSREDTLAHIECVQNILNDFAAEVYSRAWHHDESKLSEPEKSLFDEWSPKLSEMEYGSDEYMDALDSLGPALEHHYRENRHHPEHFLDGVIDMNLFDLLEMLADWKAASERVSDGSVEKSLAINFKRFSIPPYIAQVLANTAADLGWVERR